MTTDGDKSADGSDDTKTDPLWIPPPVIRLTSDHINYKEIAKTAAELVSQSGRALEDGSDPSKKGESSGF